MINYKDIPKFIANQYQFTGNSMRGRHKFSYEGRLYTCPDCSATYLRLYREWLNGPDPTPYVVLSYATPLAIFYDDTRRVYVFDHRWSHVSARHLNIVRQVLRGPLCDWTPLPVHERL